MIAGVYQPSTLAVNRTLKILREFAPELSQEMNKEINVELRKISEYAKTLMPSGDFHPSGWTKTTPGVWGTRLKFNTQLAKNRIKPTRGKNRNTYTGFVNRYGITNPDAAGSVYELAGRRNANGRVSSLAKNKNAGKYFIAAINEGNSTETPTVNSGRAMFPAVERHKVQVIAAIEASITKAITKSNIKLDG